MGLIDSRTCEAFEICQCLIGVCRLRGTHQNVFEDGGKQLTFRRVRCRRLKIRIGPHDVLQAVRLEQSDNCSAIQLRSEKQVFDVQCAHTL
jgi:hypothetical protein